MAAQQLSHDAVNEAIMEGWRLTWKRTYTEGFAAIPVETRQSWEQLSAICDLALRALRAAPPSSEPVAWVCEDKTWRSL